MAKQELRQIIRVGGVDLDGCGLLLDDLVAGHAADVVHVPVFGHQAEGDPGPAATDEDGWVWPAESLGAVEHVRRGRVTPVEAFAAEFVKFRKAEGIKSWRAEELILEKWIIPAIGALRLNEVLKPYCIVICSFDGNVFQAR